MFTICHQNMEGFEASHYFFLKGICFLYFDIWSILVIENLGECAERSRRVTLHRVFVGIRAFLLYFQGIKLLQGNREFGLRRCLEGLEGGRGLATVVLTRLWVTYNTARGQ
jgi:hypothetical protein